MFGFFKKKKKEEPAAPLSVKEQALANMRKARAELGDETIQQWANKIKFEELKASLKHDIEHDEDKRNRLLDEMRWGMDQDR